MVLSKFLREGDSSSLATFVFYMIKIKYKKIIILTFFLYFSRNQNSFKVCLVFKKVEGGVDPFWWFRFLTLMNSIEEEEK